MGLEEPRIQLRGKEAEQYRKNFAEIDWTKRRDDGQADNLQPSK